MNRKIFSIVAFLSAVLAFNIYSQESDISSKYSLDNTNNPFSKEIDDNDFDYLIQHINKIGLTAPFLYKDYAVFMAKKDARYVGISFDFEKFRTIHSFQLRKITDFDDKETDSYFFYVQKLPKEVQSVGYRIVIDGLWTTDPLNDKKVYDSASNLTISYLDVKREIPLVTEETKKGIIRFIYKGKTGQNVRLGGSFTNWDSWIYEMKETVPGTYELNLPLPPGKYEYAFFSGMTSVADAGNPVKVYTNDGKVASLLIVN